LNLKLSKGHKKSRLMVGFSIRNLVEATGTE